MPASLVRVHPSPDAATKPLEVAASSEKEGVASAADTALSAHRHLSAKQSSVLGPLYALFFAHYSGVVDLNDLRARDGALAILSAIVLAVDAAYYRLSVVEDRSFDETAVRALFWTSVALKALTVFDYVLRLLQPAWSVMDLATAVVRRCFPKQQSPFPMAAVLPRYVMYFLTFTGNLVIRFVVSESFGLLVIQAFITMSMISSSVCHVCFVYAIFFKMMGGSKHRRGKPVTRFGALVPDQLRHVQFTALGPEWKDDGEAEPPNCSSPTSATQASGSVPPV